MSAKKTHVCDFDGQNEKGIHNVCQQLTVH
jgi:hypothetical protein